MKPQCPKKEPCGEREEGSLMRFIHFHFFIQTQISVIRSNDIVRIKLKREKKKCVCVCVSERERKKAISSQMLNEDHLKRRNNLVK